MASIKVKIVDPIGLHARPASVIVQVASKFKSDVKIKAAGKEANLKSIMSVMAMAVKTGTEITVVAEGPDAEKALEEIKKSMKTNKLI